MREHKYRVWYREKIVLKSLNDMLTDPSDNFMFLDGEVTEFTGLTDKSGKEIWEGDIVRINHPEDRTGDFTNAVGEVFWWDEEGGWYHGNNHGRPPKRMWDYVEVIGNVYENPELMRIKP